jgi:hypothetical protein
MTMRAHAGLPGSWISHFRIIGTHDIVFLALGHALGLGSRVTLTHVFKSNAGGLIRQEAILSVFFESLDI